MSDKTSNPPDPSAEGDPWRGRVLAGRYRIDALLGSGSMGRVYRAEHVHMHKPLAVKILNPEHTKNAELVARFEREAIAAANIDHVNVVAAIDFGKLEDGSVYLSLELVEGKNLRAEIARGGALDGRRALHIARQMAAGLAAAHAKNIVHRDLKPENVVLVDRDGDPDFVKILDFGIAKLAPESGKGQLTKVGVVLGTLDYMAPEQALGQPVDHRADLYALGAVLYEMLCGACPYEGESASAILALQLKKPPPSLRERSPGLNVPAGVEALVMKLLAKERAERPQSASSVAAELERLLALVPKAAPARTVPPVALPPRPVVNKPTFLPTDPLPAFTFPPLEEEGKKLAADVKQALAEQAAATSSSPSVDALLAMPAPAPKPPAAPESSGSSAASADALLSKGPSGEAATAAPKPEPGARLRAVSRRALEAALFAIDEGRRYLPRSIRRPLRRVPSGALLIALVLLFLIAVYFAGCA